MCLVDIKRQDKETKTMKEELKKLTIEQLEERQKLIEQGNEEEAVDAFIELFGWVDSKGDFHLYLGDFEEHYKGKWKSDEEFVQNLLENYDEIPRDIPYYIIIDWETTAKNVMADYSEENGHYFRNL